MAVACSFDFLEFAFPTSDPPSWHAQVERWYQMDAASYGLCELWTKAADQIAPGLIFLASPGGCNEMDQQFVKSGAASPSKFVYTLPSTRSSALLQLMHWQGPLFCVQNDPATIVSALSEAAALVEGQQAVWILGSQHTDKNLAFRIRLGNTGSLVLQPSTKVTPDTVTDMQLLNWLKNPTTHLNLNTGWILQTSGGLT
jgi:hypothetical protein